MPEESVNNERDELLRREDNAPSSACTRVGYCWWGSCVFTVLAVVILSGFPMLVGSALLWSKITQEFFAIANDYNDVVCFSCIIFFTITVAFLLAIAIIMVFAIPLVYVCVDENKRIRSSASFVCFCGIMFVAGFILIICQPIWFAFNMNIVKNYEESSNITFHKQLNDTDIRAIWEVYQDKFKCCGYQNYNDYEDLYKNNSVPSYCCNKTTVPKNRDCLEIIKNVTQKEINSSEIYTEGCPKTIVHFLNLDSTLVVNIGIAYAVFSGFFFLAPIVMIVLSFLLTAKNKDDAKQIGREMWRGLIYVLRFFCREITPKEATLHTEINRSRSISD